MSEEQKSAVREGDEEFPGSENFSKGYTLLNLLQEENKIDGATTTDYKGKFFKLHD